MKNTRTFFLHQGKEISLRDVDSQADFGRQTGNGEGIVKNKRKGKCGGTRPD